jgi:outer membrane lipoprotein-sorting protein
MHSRHVKLFHSWLYRWLAASLLSVFASYPVLSMAADWNIDQLMQSLSQTKLGHAKFTEKKYIAMLDRPVESSGELLYSAPDHLEKRTVKPRPETMVVDGNQMTIERGSQRRTVQLQEYPELAGFIDSIRGTLAGDRKALERSFKLNLEGGPEHWTLTLFPLDAKLARNVHLIRITGSHDNIRTMEIIEPDGDHSVMSIERMSAQ